MASTSGAAANCGKEIARSVPRGSALVVDDDEDQQQLLSAFLTQAGYGVQLASSAEEAFAALASRTGAPNHRAYTMIGDAVNVAARLMQIAGAGEILMTGDVARTAPDLLRALNAEQMKVDLKGKDQPVAYFRVRRETCVAREMARMSDTGRLVISMAGAK